VRSPIGAAVALISNKTPVPYVGRQNLSLPFRAPTGAEAEMRAMGANGTLFAIIDKLAGGTAEVEWGLYRKSASGKEEDRVQVTRHAALDLWNHPNDHFTRQEFVETTQQHFELTGEMWWVVGRDRRASIPLELWPVRPDRMEPVPSAEDYLAGYIYTGPDGEKVPLGIDDVIYLRRPNPLDPYRGLSAVGAILLDLDADRFAREYNRNFFRNSAEPGGIIEVDRSLGDDEFNILRDRWAEQHQGVANAHRVAIIEAGRWIERKYSMTDMQFAELREVSTEQIRQAFGFPKPMLGAVDDVNRANAEAAEYVFGKWLIKPRCGRIKGALCNDLLRLFGAQDQLEFDHEEVVAENEELENQTLTARANAAKTLVDAGFDPAGVLEAVDLPELTYNPPIAPLPPGDVAPAGGPATPGRRAPTQEVAAQLVEALLASIPGTLEHARHSALPVAAAEDKLARQDWEVRLDDLLKAWEDILADQRKELAGQVERVVTAGRPEDLATLKASSDRAAEALTKVMFAQAAAGGRRMAEAAASQGVAISPVAPDAGISAAVIPRVVKVIEGLASDLKAAAKVTASFLAGGLSATAGRAALRAWAPGATGADVAATVSSQLEGLSEAGPRRELGGAIWAAENEGRFATLEQAEKDGVGAARYVATEVNDAGTCEPCAEIDGTVFESLSDAMDAYPFGGYVDCEGMSNCRGSIDPQWD
jgi:HK97 family phage portal protein